MKGITDSLFLEVAELSVSSAFLVLSWLPSNWKLVGCTDRQVTSDMEWVTCTDGLSGLGQLYRLLNHFWYGVGQLYRQLIRNGSDVQIAKLLLIIMEWVSCTDCFLPSYFWYGVGQLYRLLFAKLLLIWSGSVVQTATLLLIWNGSVWQTAYRDWAICTDCRATSDMEWVTCTDCQVTTDMEWVDCTDGLLGLGQLHRLPSYFWYGVGHLYRLPSYFWYGVGHLYRLPSYFWNGVGHLYRLWNGVGHLYRLPSYFCYGVGHLYRLPSYFWYGVGHLYRHLIRTGPVVQIAKLLLIWCGSVLQTAFKDAQVVLNLDRATDVDCFETMCCTSKDRWYVPPLLQSCVSYLQHRERREWCSLKLMMTQLKCLLRIRREWKGNLKLPGFLKKDQSTQTVKKNTHFNETMEKRCVHFCGRFLFQATKNYSMNNPTSTKIT